MAIDGQVPSTDYLDYIRKLEQRISTLENGRTLRNVVIPEGGLQIRGGGELRVDTEDGVQMFLLGRLISGSTPFRGFILRRENGSFLFYTNIVGGDPDKVFFAWLDNQGNILFSDDGVSGGGIAKPWLSMPTVPVLSSSIPVTTGATWVSVYSTGWILKQQPAIEVQALLYSTGGGVGEARYTINGNPVGAVMSIASGAFAWSSISPFTLPGAISSYVRVELQVQRTNGAGSVGGVLVATQRQSV
jgi:hypothetical protein